MWDRSLLHVLAALAISVGACSSDSPGEEVATASPSGGGNDTGDTASNGGSGTEATSGGGASGGDTDEANGSGGETGDVSQNTAGTESSVGGSNVEDMSGGGNGGGNIAPSDRPLGSWVEVEGTLSGTTPVRLNDGSVLLVGGFGSSAVFRFYPEDNGAVRLNDLPEARGNFAAALLEDGRVLIAGGNNRDERDGTASALLYDPALDEWTPTGDMPEARYEVQGVRLPDGDVLVMGGASAGVGGVPSSDVYRYRVGDGEWDTLSPLEQAARYHQLFLFGQDTVLVASPNPQVYEVSSQSVLSSPSFDVYREFFAAVQLPDENVVVLGGTPIASGEQRFDFATQFSPGATAWTDLAPLPTPKFGHAAATLSDGTILVVGGTSITPRDDADPSLQAAHRYIPSLDTWFDEAQPPSEVGGAIAQLLDDGSVLFILGGTLRFYPEPWQ